MDPIKCLPFRRVVVFIFHPTDQELLLGYLQPFLEGKPLLMNKIHQQNVYGFNLVQLPGRSNISPSSMGSSSTASHPKTENNISPSSRLGCLVPGLLNPYLYFLFRIASSLGLDVPEH
ncbi:hypothetical protein DY000_02044134 [Brassica cretica]|uniref:Uncharacterized protein n=1 Tax=Brassica cretica TaxID=69181 RepID=A0ABQ7F417_BRACR|nr:hypothetical protein DY000_02044134 [Brassica cretica]